MFSLHLHTFDKYTLSEYCKTKSIFGTGGPI